MTDKFPPHHADTKAVRSADEHTGAAPTHDDTHKLIQKSTSDDLVTREAELQKARAQHVGAIEGQRTPNTTEKHSEVKPGK